MIYEDNQLSELAGIFFKNLRKKKSHIRERISGIVES